MYWRSTRHYWENLILVCMNRKQPYSTTKLRSISLFSKPHHIKYTCVSIPIHHFSYLSLTTQHYYFHICHITTISHIMHITFYCSVAPIRNAPSEGFTNQFSANFRHLSLQLWLGEWFTLQSIHIFIKFIKKTTNALWFYECNIIV